MALGEEEAAAGGCASGCCCPRQRGWNSHSGSLCPVEGRMTQFTAKGVLARPRLSY